MVALETEELPQFAPEGVLTISEIDSPHDPC